jgi:XTP/dITP diphosphohydrolase
MTKLVFASTNANKIDIFEASFNELGLNQHFELLTLKDFPELKNVSIDEPGNSFEEDALIKAKEYSKLTGLPAISQDRGFVFKALNWPGTQSKLVMDGDEKIAIKFHNQSDKPLDIIQKHRQNSEIALAKLNGITDRRMDIEQAIAVCLPSGEEFADLHVCHGFASFEVVDINDSSMTSFFIPEGFDIAMGGWSKEEIFDFDVKYRYPITSNIVKFLLDKLA